MDVHVHIRKPSMDISTIQCIIVLQFTHMTHSKDKNEAINEHFIFSSIEWYFTKNNQFIKNTYEPIIVHSHAFIQEF